jgi:ssDNA thymidine ADP-ribosyltransferase, DarT
MPKSLQETLNPEKALIFRIVHRSNLSWALANGLHCRSSGRQDPNFVAIGNAEIIARRRSREVPIEPGGDLADYVPFYFTPYSPMLFNIRTGYGGIQQRRNDEIVSLVSSLGRLEELGVRYVFTDRHALFAAARFFNRRADLRHVDFDLLQRRDFQRDENDPGKLERYQAEALAHQCVPVEALLGVVCYTQEAQREVEAAIASAGVDLRVFSRPGWYFQ